MFDYVGCVEKKAGDPMYSFAYHNQYCLSYRFALCFRVPQHFEGILLAFKAKYFDFWDEILTPAAPRW